MLGLKTDQEVLGELVKAKAPAVGQLMAQYPGIWTLVVSRWFICLYIDILPIEVRKWPDETVFLKVVTGVVCALTDGSEDLGLSVLRGIQSSVPSGSDTRPSSPAGDPESTLSARRLWMLQADDLWSVHHGLPRFHAGEKKGREPAEHGWLQSRYNTQKASVFRCFRGFPLQMHWKKIKAKFII